ncbi:MAG: baseplate J/gp47 family protein [Spirochaetales bacterium]|nr:baseplate J/gp47 family protein [Spirochaetales bacterium]
MTYGLTAEGYIPKTLPVITEELEKEYKALYGDDLDVSSDSAMGQWIGVSAKREALIWEGLQELYASRDPNSAEDVPLDNICDFTGTKRLKALKTYAPILLRGVDGTSVESGKRVKQSTASNPVDFILREDILISSQSISEALLSIPEVLNSTQYQVTLDDTVFSYESSADASLTEILQALYLQITETWSGNCVIKDDSFLLVYDYDSSFAISCNDNFSLDEIWSPGIADAEVTGKYPAPAGTINEIVTSVTDWEEVKNVVQGITGRDTETNAELRIRRRQSLRAKGNATDESIRSGLLEDVEGVVDAQVFSNRKDAVDSKGRPGHSFETVVEGGDEDVIAAKIWEKMGSGIEPYGSITKTVKDSTGKDQTICFSRPVAKYLWIKVQYSLYSEESFPENGEELIRTSILEFAAEEYSKGKDVIRKRLSSPIYETTGIEDIDIFICLTAAPEDDPEYHQNNIPIDETEFAEAAAGRIILEAQ